MYYTIIICYMISQSQPGGARCPSGPAGRANTIITIIAAITIITIVNIIIVITMITITIAMITIINIIITMIAGFARRRVAAHRGEHERMSRATPSSCHPYPSLNTIISIIIMK